MKPVRTVLPKGLAVLFLLIVFTGAASAKIPEPSNIYWGTVKIGDTDITAGNAYVLVSVAIEGNTIASYRMGDNKVIGDRYLLKIPMDAEGDRVANMARSGDTAIIYVSGIEFNSITVGERGTVSELNLAVVSNCIFSHLLSQICCQRASPARLPQQLLRLSPR